jgi:hypothetical protein
VRAFLDPVRKRKNLTIRKLKSKVEIPTVSYFALYLSSQAGLKPFNCSLLTDSVSVRQYGINGVELRTARGEAHGLRQKGNPALC